MNNNNEISNNEILLRYINFVENSIPVVRECLDYISNSERHLHDALIQNNINIDTNNQPSIPLSHMHRTNSRSARRRDRSDSRDTLHNVRQHNINNNRLRNREPQNNDLVNDISNIFNSLNNPSETNNPNNLFNYMNNLQNMFNQQPQPNIMFGAVPQNLSPVIVRPTEQQINNACETIVFSSIVNPVNSNCPITIEPFQPNDMITRIRFCGHCFKPEALQRWFTSNVRCPICRYDIRTYVNNINMVNEENNFTPDNIPQSEFNNEEGRIDNNENESNLPQMDPSINIFHATFHYNIRSLPTNNETTQNETIQNETTQNETTQNETTQNEITQNENTQNNNDQV